MPALLCWSLWALIVVFEPNPRLGTYTVRNYKIVFHVWLVLNCTSGQQTRCTNTLSMSYEHWCNSLPYRYTEKMTMMEWSIASIINFTIQVPFKFNRIQPLGECLCGIDKEISENNNNKRTAGYSLTIKLPKTPIYEKLNDLLYWFGDIPVDFQSMSISKSR